MKAENKMLASVGGIATLAAVVIGASVATATHTSSPPAHPAGQPVIATTVTVSASPTPVASTSASSLTVKPRTHPRAVTRQDAPVTTPTDTTSQPPPVDLGPGTIDQGGVHRAPNPTSHAAPPPPEKGPPPQTIPSPSSSS
jgi:hypothetical protein